MIDHDEDDVLGYDADLSDDSQYCQHGTFIGSWWGPDDLCAWCEGGLSVEDMHQARRAAHDREVLRALETQDSVGSELRFTGSHLHWWVHHFTPAMIAQAGITMEDLERLDTT